MYRYLIVALVLTGCASSGSTFTRPADVFNPVGYTHWGQCRRLCGGQHADRRRAQQFPGSADRPRLEGQCAGCPFGLGGPVKCAPI
jgi:hypothetical protein